MRLRDVGSLPEAVCLIPSLHDVVMLEQGSDGVQRFRMLVYSGKPIPNHGFFGGFAVRLDGIKWEGDRLPVLLDHDTATRLGYTTELKVTAKGLMAEGVMLTNTAAQEVALDSKAGFPWQASMYVRATKALDIEAGEEHEVNGHKLIGPATVFEECVLREVTFTALGADSHTSAAVLARNNAQQAAAQVREGSMDPEKKIETPPPATPPVDEGKLRAEASAKAQADERARVTAILASGSTEQGPLMQELIAKGTSLQDSLLALNADLRARLSAKAAPAAPEAKPLGSEARPKQPVKLADKPEGPALWTEQWETDEALRDEFMGNKAAWLSFKANEHRCRDYGSAAAFAASGSNQ